MSTASYNGTLFLQRVQGRLFLTVSIWWASLQPGDVLTGGIVSQLPAKRKGTSSYHITKTSRLSQKREQHEMELETLNVQDQDVVVLRIWRKGLLLASTRYRIVVNDLRHGSGTLSVKDEVTLEIYRLGSSYELRFLKQFDMVIGSERDVIECLCRIIPVTDACDL